MNHFRQAVRSLINSPAYTLIALLTLACGIGVNTSMFSVVDALLFRTAPFPEPESLLVIESTTRNGEGRFFSEPEIREIVPAATAFSSVATVGFLAQAWSEPGRPPERLTGLGMSREMEDTFRIKPLHGRSFAAEEYDAGRNQVILLSESFWLSRYGGDRSVIGKTLRLDTELVTIIGVLPASAEYHMLWGSIAFWRPLNFTPDQKAYRAYRSFNLFGRLKPGANAAHLPAQLAAVAATQEKNFPQDYSGLRYRARLVHEVAMDRTGRMISWMLLALSGFVLLLACANLANLQLARATSSTREFAIRAALGASRSRLLAQQLTECIVLSLAGGGLGFLVALWVNGVLERSIRIAATNSLQIRIDGSVLLATLGVSLLTGVIFGVVPALFASRTNVTTALKSQARGSTAGRGHKLMRHSLIVGEVALALMLLGGAAIMYRGMQGILDRKVGWDTQRVITAILPIPESRYESGAKRIELYRRIQERMSALPGVEHTSLATSIPLFNMGSDRQVFTDAANATPGQSPIASHVMIAGDYFATTGIRLLEGRQFPADIHSESPQYILVNQALARRFWPNESAVGKRLGVQSSDTGTMTTVFREIIGVVSDVEPAAAVANPSTPYNVYRPLVQEPWSFVFVVLRSQNPSALAEPLRRAMAEVDPDMPANDIGTVAQFVERAQHNLYVVAGLLAGFAALGLVLAAVGIYGVISNLVAQRTPEFGIRLALGAQPGDVLRHVLKGGAVVAGIGVIVGLALAAGLGFVLKQAMPRIAETDPFALALTAAVLAIVSLIACWIPARRATRVDPLIALRAE